jgi:DNA-binding MarR family transcriptional regulator
LDDSAAFRLESFLPYRLTLLSGAVSQVFAQLCERHALSISEWFALIALGQVGPMTAKALGVRSHMHKTKVSRLVGRLLERGLITRRLNDVDRREAILCLTPAGKELHEEYTRRAVEVAASLEDAIAADDREALDRCLLRLAEKSAELMTLTPYDHHL